jgi:hypothetical protein
MFLTAANDASFQQPPDFAYPVKSLPADERVADLVVSPQTLQRPLADFQESTQFVGVHPGVSLVFRFPFRLSFFLIIGYTPGNPVNFCLQVIVCL